MRELVTGPGREVYQEGQHYKTWLTTVHWEDCRYALDRLSLRSGEAENLHLHGYERWRTGFGHNPPYSKFQGCKVCGTTAPGEEFYAALEVALERKAQEERKRKAQEAEGARLNRELRAEREYTAALVREHSDEIAGARLEARQQWEQEHPDLVQLIKEMEEEEA